MKTGMRWAFAAGILAGVCALAVADDDLASVEKQLNEAWAKHKSMTANITLKSHMEMGGMVITGDGKGTVEFMRKGGKHYARMDMTNNMAQKMGDKETKLSQVMLMISDGKNTYTLSEMDNRKMAVKTDVDEKITGNPGAILKEYRRSYSLKLMPEESIDDTKVFVIEGTPKKAGPMGSGRIMTYFRQDNGIMVKMVMYSPDNKQPMQTMTYTDVKLDVDIKPDRFVFKAPEGVTVVDQTGKKP